MTIRIFLLSIILHFQTNAQLGFDSYGMYYGDKHLKDLILHFIQNKASDFTLKIRLYEKGKLQNKYKCSYAIHDSILYQSCGSHKNEHRIVGDYLDWISDFSDPEDPVLSNERVVITRKDSANANIRTFYRISGTDTTLTWTTRSCFEKEKRIEIHSISTNENEPWRKHEFEYFQNDSVVETIHEFTNGQWALYRKINTKQVANSKIITEYKPGQADPVSKTTFLFKDKQIVKLIIDYNDQKKRTMLYNARYVIEPQKVKFRAF